MSGFEHVPSVWAGWLPPRVPGMLVLLPLILPPPPTLLSSSVTQRLLGTSEQLLFFSFSFFLGLEPQSGDVVTRMLPFIITFPLVQAGLLPSKDPRRWEAPCTTVGRCLP